MGGRGGLEIYEAFFSRKACWAKRPTRASLVTIGLRGLLLLVRPSWMSFARLRASKRPELVGMLACPRGSAAPPPMALHIAARVAWALRFDAKAEARSLRVVARIVVRARCGSFLFVAAGASSPHLCDTLLSAVLGACRSGVLRGVNAHREPTKSVARVEDVPRAVILLVVTNFSCRRVFFSFRFSRLVG